MNRWIVWNIVKLFTMFNHIYLLVDALVDSTLDMVSKRDEVWFKYWTSNGLNVYNSQVMSYVIIEFCLIRNYILLSTYLVFSWLFVLGVNRVYTSLWTCLRFRIKKFSITNCLKIWENGKSFFKINLLFPVIFDIIWIKYSNNTRDIYWI